MSGGKHRVGGAVSDWLPYRNETHRVHNAINSGRWQHAAEVRLQRVGKCAARCTTIGFSSCGPDGLGEMRTPRSNDGSPKTARTWDGVGRLLPEMARLRPSHASGLLRCVSPVLARNGHHGRAERRPLSGVEQASIERCKMSGDDPNVWSGRASQGDTSIWRVRSCINVSGL